MSANTLGRVAAATGRLAGGQSGLARRATDPRERIDHQQNVEPARAQRVGLRERDLGGADPFRRTSVGRCADDRRARLAARDPPLRLAAALADEGEHHRIGAGTAGDRVEQHRLSGAGRAEQADPRARVRTRAVRRSRARRST